MNCISAPEALLVKTLFPASFATVVMAAIPITAAYFFALPASLSQLSIYAICVCLAALHVVFLVMPACYLLRRSAQYSWRAAAAASALAMTLPYASTVASYSELSWPDTEGILSFFAIASTGAITGLAYWRADRNTPFRASKVKTCVSIFLLIFATVFPLVFATVSAPW